MARPLTIVMYHYVRDLDASAYPDIKGLTVKGFRHQLNYIQSRYQVVAMDEVLRASTDEARLPESPILLTFDDGLSDHYDNVFPILADRGLSAAFFPSSAPLVDGRILDVHKIHFILAVAPDTSELLRRLSDLLRENADGEDLSVELDDLTSRYESGRYDAREVTAVKRLLQRDLPRTLRSELVDELFRECVTEDQKAFREQLYMSTAQIREMRSAGMYVGCHGHDHLWLDRLAENEQRADIMKSLDFLESIGMSTSRWVMCYPYGASDRTLREQLPTMGCALGLSAQPAIADLRRDDPLDLPRLDTNHLPQDST